MVKIRVEDSYLDLYSLLHGNQEDCGLTVKGLCAFLLKKKKKQMKFQIESYMKFLVKPIFLVCIPKTFYI